MAKQMSFSGSSRLYTRTLKTMDLVYRVPTSGDITLIQFSARSPLLLITMTQSTFMPNLLVSMQHGNAKLIASANCYNDK